MEREKVIEIFIAGIFIIMLLLLTAVFISMDSETSQKTISNSYNINSYNANSYNSYVEPTKTTTQITYIKPYEQTKNQIVYLPTDYKKPETTIKYIGLKDNGKNCKTIKKDYSINYDYEINSYKHRATHSIEKNIFGNEVGKYKVYVTNKENYGEQFTVKFYFTDYSGKKITETLTKYIQPHDEKVFFYQTIYDDKYSRWDYQIFSNTKNSNSKEIEYITKKICY